MERGWRSLGVRGIAGCACGGSLPALLEAIALAVQPLEWPEAGPRDRSRFWQVVDGGYRCSVAGPASQP